MPPLLCGKRQDTKRQTHRHRKQAYGYQKWKVKVKVAQLCPTLCDPMDYTVPGILQARILEWVDFPFSRDLPDPGIKPGSPALQAGGVINQEFGISRYKLLS